jgi:hypothetical protein
MAVAAQSSPTSPLGTDFQNWDELDVLTRVASKLDVTWITRVRLSEELPNPAHFVLGTDWNMSAGKYLVVTPSFYFGRYRTTSGVVLVIGLSEFLSALRDKTKIHDAALVARRSILMFPPQSLEFDLNPQLPKRELHDPGWSAIRKFHLGCQPQWMSIRLGKRGANILSKAKRGDPANEQSSAPKNATSV